MSTVSELLYFDIPVGDKKDYSPGDWKEYAQHDNIVQGFFGQYAWLSNFYPCEIWFEGMEYPSTEHAYQAAKVNPAARLKFSQVTAAQTKKLWREEAISKLLLPDWNSRRIAVMQEVVFQKFLRHKELQLKLISTAPRYLEETNHWKDTFWGVDYQTRKGENMLGRILMATRAYFRDKQLP